jgi:hypothetical protein
MMYADSGGFGGKNCKGKNGTARCSCCQNQVKIAFEICEMGIAKELFKLKSKIQVLEPADFYRTGELIRSRIETMTRARINQRRNGG